MGEAGAGQVIKRAAGAAHGFEDLEQAAAAVVFDEDRHHWRDAELDVAVDAADLVDRHGQLGGFELAGQGPAFDENFELRGGSQDCLEEPDHKLRVTDRKTAHDP